MEVDDESTTSEGEGEGGTRGEGEDDGGIDEILPFCK